MFLIVLEKILKDLKKIHFGEECDGFVDKKYILLLDNHWKNYFNKICVTFSLVCFKRFYVSTLYEIFTKMKLYK